MNNRCCSRLIGNGDVLCTRDEWLLGNSLCSKRCRLTTTICARHRTQNTLRIRGVETSNLCALGVGHRERVALLVLGTGVKDKAAVGTCAHLAGYTGCLGTGAGGLGCEAGEDAVEAFGLREVGGVDR